MGFFKKRATGLESIAKQTKKEPSHGGAIVYGRSSPTTKKELSKYRTEQRKKAIIANTKKVGGFLYSGIKTIAQATAPIIKKEIKNAIKPKKKRKTKRKKKR